MTNIISTEGAAWALAKKTKDIKALPIATLFTDAKLASVFLLATLEANEPVERANLLCVAAEEGEAWQQASKNFFKKYSVIDIDSEGWLVCRPLPENEVEFHIAQEDGYIVGKWGATVDGIQNLQKVSKGDAIARQTYEHADQWVVNRRLWNGTYSVL